MNNMGYGAITNRDAAVLEAVLKDIGCRHDKSGTMVPFDVLEIGTHMGGTARGIKDWCEVNGYALRYIGIESGAICTPTVPFDGATLVVGDSINCDYQIQGLFDLVYVDGCHDGLHVVFETISYGKKVRRNGFMLFHDTAPHIQQTMREAAGPDTPFFYNSVNAAHEFMGFPTKEWVLWKEDYDPDAKVGGMRAYRKVG